MAPISLFGLASKPYTVVVGYTTSNATVLVLSITTCTQLYIIVYMQPSPLHACTRLAAKLNIVQKQQIMFCFKQAKDQ